MTEPVPPSVWYLPADEFQELLDWLDEPADLPTGLLAALRRSPAD